MTGFRLVIMAGMLAVLPGLAMGQQAQRPRQPAPPPAPAAPPPEPAPSAYEPQLLRLSEILGALTHLSELCRPDGPRLNAAAEGEAWRARMAELIEAEANHPAQRERLAGAYNRGLNGYQTTYRLCTPSGKDALQRLLAEGRRIAQDIGNRFGS